MPRITFMEGDVLKNDLYLVVQTCIPQAKCGLPQTRVLIPSDF